jgi:solute carrier family 25 2-oxodicarboxylate transporter 21
MTLCFAAQTLSKKFAAGVVGGMLGVLFATPFDVVKSRMQNQLADSAKVYHYTLPSLVHILRTEGFGALYKGIGPRIVRLGPGGGIMIVAFDVVSNLLRDI